MDAHLTPLGWQQAHALRGHLRSLGPAFRADVVVISPLTRTLETAAGAFGTGKWCLGDAGRAFMLPQEAVPGKRAAQAGISAHGCPPLVAWEGCREHLGECAAAIVLSLLFHWRCSRRSLARNPAVPGMTPLLSSHITTILSPSRPARQACIPAISGGASARLRPAFRLSTSARSRWGSNASPALNFPALNDHAATYPMPC